MKTQESEAVRIKKSKTILVNDFYKTPQTSLLVFHFEPQLFISSDLRLQNCSIKHADIAGKDLYVFDDFFSTSEGLEMRDFSKRASFSRNSYGSVEAIAKGEKPARSMNGRERWQFFSHPPQGINELYKLFGSFAHRMNAEITTLPWELCDQTSNGSPAVIANFLEEASHESMELGKHQDCSPEKGIAFGVPILYEEKEKFYPSLFENGGEGNPWLISIMLYVTEDNYLPEYCMGTVFYEREDEIILRTGCRHMRLVLFEGDIFHTIEESKIPSTTQTWRVSYVFKLLVNPRCPGQSMKKAFFDLINHLSVKFCGTLLGKDARI